MDGLNSPLAEQTTPIRRRPLVHALAAGVAVALLIATGVEIYSFNGGNVHEVIPGGVYRSAQPTAGQLETLVHKYGIRTVINMRGCDPSPWYIEESHATARLDLSQEDLPFTAGRLPSVPVIRHLVEILDRSEWPILIHCRQGSDRTGMTSAIVLLLYTDTSLDTALHQLSPRYGHLPLGRPANLDRFFELYREWLAAKGWTHSRPAFRRWIEKEYCPGECLASFEILEPNSRPLVMRRGEPLAVRLRCTNQSVKPWFFRPGTNAGIHAFWELLDTSDGGLISGRSGLLYATVLPQSSIDLTLAIPAQDTLGRYRLRIDLVDEQHAHFHELGPEALKVELEVR